MFAARCAMFLVVVMIMATDVAGALSADDAAHIAAASFDAAGAASLAAPSKIATKQRGFTGAGYAATPATGGEIAFRIDPAAHVAGALPALPALPAHGFTAVPHFRYACSDTGCNTNKRPMDLLVDGVVVETIVPFSSGGWAVWGEVAALTRVAFVPGNTTTIVLRVVGFKGPHVDALFLRDPVAAAPPAPPACEDNDAGVVSFIRGRTGAATAITGCADAAARIGVFCELYEEQGATFCPQTCKGAAYATCANSGAAAAAGAPALRDPVALECSGMDYILCNAHCGEVCLPCAARCSCARALPKSNVCFSRLVAGGLFWGAFFVCVCVVCVFAWRCR